MVKETNFIGMDKVATLPIFTNSGTNGDLIKLDENSNTITDNPLANGAKRFGKVSFWLVSLLIVGSIIFFLPTILKTIGMLILAGIGVGLIGVGSILYPQVIRWTKNYADKLYIEDIMKNPVQYINTQIAKKRNERKSFGINKAEIEGLGERFELESIKKSKSVTNDRESIISLKANADLIKGKMELIKSETSTPWNVDKYNELEKELKYLMGEYLIIEQRLILNESLARRYALRHGEIMKHLKTIDNHTIALDIYINKLVATGEMLKDELEFTNSSKEMNKHSLSILGATSKDEVKRIINVITNKIEKDSAEISAGLNEVSDATRELNLNSNSDEVFNKLSRTVEKIKSTNIEFDVNEYKNPDYQLSNEDKIAKSSPRNFL